MKNPFEVFFGRKPNKPMPPDTDANADVQLLLECQEGEVRLQFVLYTALNSPLFRKSLLGRIHYEHISKFHEAILLNYVVMLGCVGNTTARHSRIS